MTVCGGYHCQWIRGRFPRFTEAFGVWRLAGIKAVFNVPALFTHLR